MPRSYLLKASIYFIQEKTKFNALITENIRIWGTACFNLCNGVGYHFFFVLFLQRDHFKRNFHLIADLLNKAQVVFPRTITQVRKLVFQPNFKIKGSYIMPLVFKQLKRN